MKVFLYSVSVVFLFNCNQSFGQSKRAKRILKNNIEFSLRNFDPTQPISLEKYENDQIDAIGELENALFSEGFNVISTKVAQDIKSISNPNVLENKNIEITSVQKYKSVYVLTISGNIRSDTGCGGLVPSNLTGRIIDLVNDGQLVGTFKFKQSVLAGKCMSYIAEAVAHGLKNYDSTSN